MQVKRYQFICFFSRKARTMKNESLRLKRLTVREFDATILEELTRQGRVFIALPRQEGSDVYKLEVLSYVERISGYATEDWMPRVSLLWQQIVDCPQLAEMLIMKKGLQAGHMNRYVVTNIVALLQSEGVYSNDVKVIKLHLELEGVTVKNKFYTNSGNYALSRESKKLLRQLLGKSIK